jgi:hypothetical protein
MKKLIATFLILLPLLALTAPTVFADNTETSTEDKAKAEAVIKDSSSFDVFDILTPEKEDESTSRDIITQAEAEGTSPVGIIILKAINILMLTIGTFAFVLIIIGGFMFATSGGDEPKIDRAKAILTQSIMGLIIAFGSYMIVYFIQSFFY